MKILFYSFFFFIILLSCSSNETEDKTPISDNTVVIDSVEWGVKNAYFIKDKTENSPEYAHILVLTDGSFLNDSINTEDLFLNKLSDDTKTLIVFWIKSDPPLQSGEYVLDNSKTFSKGFITWVGAITNLKVSQGEMMGYDLKLTSDEAISEAKVNVLWDGNNYSIKYLCTYRNNKTIEGAYKGNPLYR